jgi:hypothetical protein
MSRNPERGRAALTHSGLLCQFCLHYQNIPFCLLYPDLVVFQPHFLSSSFFKGGHRPYVVGLIFSSWYTFPVHSCLDIIDSKSTFWSVLK